MNEEEVSPTPVYRSSPDGGLYEFAEGSEALLAFDHNLKAIEYIELEQKLIQWGEVGDRFEPFRIEQTTGRRHADDSDTTYRLDDADLHMNYNPTE